MEMELKTESTDELSSSRYAEEPRADASTPPAELQQQLASIAPLGALCYLVHPQ